MEITWDEWYYNICVEMSKKSHCMSRQIGAILVKDKSIIAQGYNGPPRGIPHCNVRHQYDKLLLNEYHKHGLNISKESIVTKCPRQLLGFKSGEGLLWCCAGHAERNTLINAARNGIVTKGAKLYMSCNIPCSPCMVEIINVGIEEIIVINLTSYDITAQYLLDNSNIKYRVFNHLKDKINEK